MFQGNRRLSHSVQTWSSTVFESMLDFKDLGEFLQGLRLWPLNRLFNIMLEFRAWRVLSTVSFT